MNYFCKRTLPALLLIILAGSVIYSNTLDAPFVFDDQHSIVNNIVIESPENVFIGLKLGLKFVQNRVVSFLTFAWNYQYGGLNVFGYHLVNLGIHLLAALLIYMTLRLTFATPYFKNKDQQTTARPYYVAPEYFVPLFAALLFVAHPVQTQAVTYIIQRMASLTTLFYLLSLLLYTMGRLAIERPSSRRVSIVLYFSGSVLAALLAMKTKEIAFTLPLAIALYEVFFFQGNWKRRLLYLFPLLATLPVIPLTILGLLNIGVDEQISVQAEPVNQEILRVQTSMPRVDYLLTQFRVIVTYLRLVILPVNQNLDYDYPSFETFLTAPVLLSFLLLTAITAIAIYLFFISRNTVRNQSNASSGLLRLTSFGILWFFLTLSVESSLIPIKDVIMEHRLYLPMFGAAVALAALFCLMMKNLTGQLTSKLLPITASALVLILCIATFQRNQVWADPVHLWQDAAEKSPNKARPLNNLGKALEESGQRDEALKAFSRAIQIDPNYYKAYYNLADLYLVSDQPETALRLLQAAIRLHPDFTEAYVSIGAALMRAGRFVQVAAFLQKNLDRIANEAEARFYLGAAYAFLGNREAALRELRVLSTLDPEYAANLKGMLGMPMNQGGSQGQN